jgi:glucan endo-1,3-alpha-glucosidase
MLPNFNGAMALWCLPLLEACVILFVVTTFLTIFLDGFDWSGVRSAVGKPLEIIPFYQAAQAHQDSTDGLFMWNAWPSQNNQPIDQTMSIAGDQLLVLVL